MLKDRAELSEVLTKQFQKIVFKPKECKAIYDMAAEKYDIPSGVAADIVSMRISAAELDYFLLYAIADCTETCLNTRKIVDIFFSDPEKKMYGTMKYEKGEIKFPLRIKMIPVGTDQWIGAISVQTIYKLCKAQLLAYNANTQRAMKMNIVRGQKVYKPAISMPAVKAIQQTMVDGVYIPNTLTFNVIDEDDFYYDKDSSELVIRSLKHFDITDGYHRYQAIIRILNDNPDFDMNMELRITNFSEDKAKQFIYQEDQKTKMRKVDSEAMNNYNAGNKVASRLNESRNSSLNGLIGGTNGIINYADFAAIINTIYFKGVKRADETQLIPVVVQQIMEAFNELLESNVELLKHEFSAKELLVVTYYAKKQYVLTGSQMSAAIQHEKMKELNYFVSQNFYKKFETIMDNIYEEVK